MYRNHFTKQHKGLRSAANACKTRFSFQEKEADGGGHIPALEGLRSAAFLTEDFSPREVNSSNAGRAPARRTTDRQPGIPCGSDHARECYP